jgi:hypothetical protein
VEVPVEDREVVEKRTTVTREDHVDQTLEPRTTNVNVGPDGDTQVQEDVDIVDDPVGSTIVRQEETIEKHQR